MEIPTNFMYFAYDGDSVGRKVGRATMANNLDELRHISELIKTGHELVKRWVKDRDGIWINGGGDEGLAAIPKECVGELEQLRKDYEYTVGHTISIGVGKEPSESGRALLIAKLKGKDQIVEFGDATEKEIVRIKKRAKKGAFKSMEEHKLAEAYLKKAEEKPKDSSNEGPAEESVDEACAYCEQSDGTDSDHCKYCHDAEPEAGAEHCKFCEQSDQEIGASDCKFCKEKSEEEQVNCPFCNEEAVEAKEPPQYEAENASNNQDKFDETGQHAPLDAKEEEAAEAINPEPAVGAIDPEDNHSKEALTAIAQQIEAEGTPLASEADAIDDTELPIGSEAEGNISRPDGFAQNTPQDLGTGGPNPPTDDQNDGDPDLSSILEEGLDSHADGIQREKAINTVSQALVQFKACRDILENTKLQSPQLYQASISMLRAMIEMASLLGLGQGNVESEQSSLGQEQAALVPEQEENEWHEPFPAHPDHGGEAKPGHAPSSASEEKEGGSIGTPIGKLSGKHTTEHVARNPMPPGAVNAKGQQKVIDPKTGDTRWIDRKQGMVQSATGVPIKPPKRGNDVPKN